MLSWPFFFVYNSLKGSLSVPMDLNTLIMLIVIPILYPASTSPLSSRFSYPTAFLSHRHLLLHVSKMQLRSPLLPLLSSFYPYVARMWHRCPLSYSGTPEYSCPFPPPLDPPHYSLVAKPINSVSKMYLNALPSLHFHWQTAFTGVQTTITSHR